MSNVKCQKLNVKCRMQDVNKVKLLSEHTSGFPPVIFLVAGLQLASICFCICKDICTGIFGGVGKED